MLFLLVLLSVMPEATADGPRPPRIPPCMIVVAYDGPSSSDIACDANDAILVKFTVVASCITSVEEVGVGLDFDGDTGDLTDLKLIDTDTGSVWMGPVTGAPYLTFNDTQLLERSGTVHLALTFDPSCDSITVDDPSPQISATIGMDAFAVYNLRGWPVLNVIPTSDILGNVHTIVVP